MNRIPLTFHNRKMMYYALQLVRVFHVKRATGLRARPFFYMLRSMLGAISAMGRRS